MHTPPTSTKISLYNLQALPSRSSNTVVSLIKHTHPPNGFSRFYTRTIFSTQRSNYLRLGVSMSFDLNFESWIKIQGSYCELLNVSYSPVVILDIKMILYLLYRITPV